MSYGYKRWLEEPDDLSRDDVIGASLLRPVREWQSGAGSIAGIVRVGDEPAPGMHVWALPASEASLRDRVGVFTDDEGAFLIEGLDPGGYSLWAQPIGDQTATPWVPERGGATDLDDTVLGNVVRVRAGRTTEDVEIRMRRGRTSRPPPANRSRDRNDPPGALIGNEPEAICSGVRVQATGPYPADGPLWFVEPDFGIGRDRWFGVTLALQWEQAADSVVFDWVGPYRDWWWIREGDEERAEFFPVWRNRGTYEYGSPRSPRLDVSISEYRIEESASAVRHTMEIAWPGTSTVGLRFRSEDEACEGEPLVVCDLGGCEIRPEG